MEYRSCLMDGELSGIGGGSRCLPNTGIDTGFSIEKNTLEKNSAEENRKSERTEAIGIIERSAARIQAGVVPAAHIG